MILVVEISVGRGAQAAGQLPPGAGQWRMACARLTAVKRGSVDELQGCPCPAGNQPPGSLQYKRSPYIVQWALGVAT